MSKDEKSFTSVGINCEKPFYINIDLNRWKYWIFNIEIFTYFIKK